MRMATAVCRSSAVSATGRVMSLGVFDFVSVFKSVFGFYFERPSIIMFCSIFQEFSTFFFSSSFFSLADERPVE